MTRIKELPPSHLSNKRYPEITIVTNHQFSGVVFLQGFVLPIPLDLYSSLLSVLIQQLHSEPFSVTGTVQVSMLSALKELTDTEEGDRQAHGCLGEEGVPLEVKNKTLEHTSTHWSVHKQHSAPKEL